MGFRELWRKQKLWMKIGFLAFIFFIIGIIPSFSDKICRNTFFSDNFVISCINILEFPYTPFIFAANQVFGLKGESNMLAIIFAMMFYPFLGIVLAVLLNSKK